MDNLAFLDTETTGLDPDRHEIWDLAYIIDGEEKVFEMDPDLSKADPFALDIGRFYERRPRWHGDIPDPDCTAAGNGWVALQVAHDLKGRHIVGAVPSFDDAFLKRFMAKHQLPVTWHYHLIDVETLAVGFLAFEGGAMTLPWNSEVLSLAVGVDPLQFERHTALGDARWAKAIYEKIVGL